MRHFSLLAIVCVALGACGFHLRGTTQASSIESVYVIADASTPIGGDLMRALGQSGVVVSGDRAAAAVTVTILADRSHRQTLTVTSQARTAEYEISREVRYRAETKAGEQLIDDRTIASARVYSIDTSNLVGSNQEEQLLNREMAQDLVAQMLRSLDAASGAKR